MIKKIIYHHRTQGKGVEGVHIREIVYAFRKKGIDVYIIGPPGINIHNKETRTDKKKETWWSQISLYLPQVLFELLEIFYNLYSYYRVNLSILKIKPQFIYERYSLFLFATALLSKKKKIPIILEVNDATFIERSRPLILKKIAALIEKRIFSNSTIIYTVSNYFRDEICALGIAARKVIVLPNAVNPGNYNNTSVANNIKKYHLENKFVIGVVGAFVPWHGLEFLINSTINLLKDKEIFILLVGDGPVRPLIESIIKKNNLVKQVVFTGFKAHSEVKNYIAAMDVCLLPNSNIHCSPMKLFEYMVMGKAIITANYKPIADIIENEKNGLLFEPLNSKQLVECILRLYEDKNMQNYLGGNAKKKVLKQYTWDRVVDNLLKKYSNLTQSDFICD